MAEAGLPARGNMGPEQPDPLAPGPGDDALSGTSAGAGTGMQGFGSAAASGAEGAGTGAGRGTGSAGPGTAAGDGPAGTRAGAEEGAVGSGYGGPVTPGGPTGVPTAKQQARSATLDGTIGQDPTDTLVGDQGSDRAQADPTVNSTATDAGSDESDSVTRDSMDSFPASDPPAY